MKNNAIKLAVSVLTVVAGIWVYNKIQEKKAKSAQ